MHFFPFNSVLALRAKTDNAPESFHSGVAKKLPPKKGNLNEWIAALEDERVRQHNKFIQAKLGIKNHKLGAKQLRHYENLKYKAEQWGKLEVIEYLMQFATTMTMPTDGLEQPRFEPSTPTVEDIAM